MKCTAAAVLVIALAAPPALAQSPPVQTRTYDYEWLYLELPQAGDDTLDFDGRLFLEDVNGPAAARSTVSGEISFNTGEGDVHLISCFLVTLPNLNLIQVGPFAQQATGDLDPAIPALEASCVLPPEILTLTCPYRGVPVTQAPGHDTFAFSGTYRTGAGLGGTYKATGQRGPILCEMTVANGTATVAAWITRVKETRRGADVSPTPLWWHEMALWQQPGDFIPTP
jgi:hypothetical protein